ncbi:hypothetical protein Tcan_08608 [Toxocara canis]|uniref:Globin domain-containing protein n=1 Tax=Toxocara canis TaxID=6265 RepID=A0A0B2UYH4_TOXCA|nr:hypothetical protein Tcan_08608 [Toxocara canis]
MVLQLVQKTMETVMNNAESISNASERRYLDEKEAVRVRTNNITSPSFRHTTLETNDSDDIPELDDMQLARAHWIQLFKTNMQATIIHNMFFYLLKKFKHIRPLWHFSRNIDDNMSWTETLRRDTQFAKHCNNVHAAFDMIMENADDPEAISDLLQELGAHHFFYEVYEPHFEVFHHSFMESMRRFLHGTEALDGRLKNAWNTIFEEIKSNMCHGLVAQRYSYLSQCITPKEMASMSAMWNKIRVQRIEEIGSNLCELALQAYNKQMKEMKLDLSIELDVQSDAFIELSQLIIGALDTTIENYNDENGFVDLPDQLQVFVHRSLVLEVCPSVLRKCFTEALISALVGVLGSTTMGNGVKQTWSKIGRVLEQVIFPLKLALTTISK